MSTHTIRTGSTVWPVVVYSVDYHFKTHKNESGPILYLEYIICVYKYFFLKKVSLEACYSSSYFLTLFRLPLVAANQLRTVFFVLLHFFFACYNSCLPNSHLRIVF